MRELHEELGITLRSAVPLQRVRHAYADQSVLLDVWRVTDFTGEPHGREGQPVRWVTSPELNDLDIPAADLPIVRALQRQPLYLITNSHRYGKNGMLALIERALSAGARLLQLREPQMSKDEYKDYARTVMVLAHRYGARAAQCRPIAGRGMWRRWCASQQSFAHGVTDAAAFSIISGRSLLPRQG